MAAGWNAELGRLEPAALKERKKLYEEMNAKYNECFDFNLGCIGGLHYAINALENLEREDIDDLFYPYS